MNRLPRLLPDSFTLAILGVVVLALVLPCSGEIARLVAIGSDIAIALLFFLQGARLSRPAVFAAILHWRLHLIIVTATFVVFPLLGLALRPLSGTVLAPPLYIGLVFLCTLPSAVQASVIFTSIAGGNVPAALCSASLSSVIGMVLTPLLVSLLLQARGGASLNGVGSIALHLLLPFIAGQVLQSRIAAWMQRHGQGVMLVDRASVLLMVYGVFSAATLSGMWSRIPASSLLVVAIVDAALLATMMASTVFRRASSRFRRARTRSRSCSVARRRALSPAFPWPMHSSPGPRWGWWSLPLMIFHQLQLMACATLARRYALGRSAREIVERFGGV